MVCSNYNYFHHPGTVSSWAGEEEIGRSLVVAVVVLHSGRRRLSFIDASVGGPKCGWAAWVIIGCPYLIMK